MSIRALVPFAVVAAVLLAPLAAQKPKKPEKQKKGEAVAEKPKDDPLTKKDKAIAALDKWLAAHPASKKNEAWRLSLSAPPEVAFDPARQYHWHLQTNKGELTIRFLHATAPRHVASAIHLTRHGFYDGLTFHRVIKQFMAQGGCPLGTGNGSPGYLLDGELAPEVKHDRPGLLSAANDYGKPKTDGSQFFLTFVPTPHLDGKHTIYGEVIAGHEVLAALEACGGDDTNDKPSEPLRIERAWVVVVDPAGDVKPEGGRDSGKDGAKPDPGKKGAGK